MEGTVTISLSNYECLKGNAEMMQHYLGLASRQVELLERIEEELHLEDLVGYVGADLMEAINKALEIWHG